MRALHLLRCLILPIGFLLSLAGCAGRDYPLTATTPTSEELVPWESPTAALTLTTRALPTATSTPFVTALPGDAHKLEVEVWPESGNLLLPIEDEVAFVTPVEELGQGDYLVFYDPRGQTIGYYSLDSGLTGILLQGKDLDLIDTVVVHPGRFLLGGGGKFWRLYDLLHREAWRVGPLCHGAAASLSPDGQWITRPCGDAQMEGVPGRHIVAEIISPWEGKGYRVALPRSENNNDPAPLLSWFAEDLLGASAVWGGDRLYACAVIFQEGFNYCPPEIPVDYSSLLKRANPAGEMIPFTDLNSTPWKSLLVPRRCFDPAQSCTGIVNLGTFDAGLRASADPNLVWWITPSDPRPVEHIGVLEWPDWQARELGAYAGDYSIVAMCPDGDCVILERADSAMHYRLDRDGALQVIPLEDIVESFSIP